MIRKDFIQFEIQKIAQVLARILGLKKEGDPEEAHALATTALIEFYALDPEQFDGKNGDPLHGLDSKTMPAEKLQLLADLLFERAHPFEHNPQTTAFLHAVLRIQNALEEEHHIASLNNLARRDLIDKFLNTEQYE